MPTITLQIPDAIYTRLREQAQREQTTVEAVVLPALERMVTELPHTQAVNAWVDSFDRLVETIHADPPDYPEGHFVDDSRESIYEGCGE